MSYYTTGDDQSRTACALEASMEVFASAPIHAWIRVAVIRGIEIRTIFPTPVGSTRTASAKVT
jgi:hypothetical protein